VSAPVEPTKSTPELSAIVLCYRAGENLRHAIEPLYLDLQASGLTFELVLVANHWEGEADPTPELAKEFASAREEVRTVVRAKRGGMGWDMRSGLDAARGEYLLVIDGDDQNPVEDVLRMYRQMKRREIDVMKGRRIARFDEYHRHVISAAYNLVFRALFRTYGLWDINGKPKGFTRTAYERMQLTSDDWFIDAEIVLEARRLGLRIDEFPVVFRNNLNRESFVRPRTILEFARNMLRQRFDRFR
jgi:glycosyltransferase involved in cell wall biosynthesis